jgi:hypothetical protein
MTEHNFMGTLIITLWYCHSPLTIRAYIDISLKYFRLETALWYIENNERHWYKYLQINGFLLLKCQYKVKKSDFSGTI